MLERIFSPASTLHSDKKENILTSSRYSFRRKRASIVKYSTRKFEKRKPPETHGSSENVINDRNRSSTLCKECDLEAIKYTRAPLSQSKPILLSAPSLPHATALCIYIVTANGKHRSVTHPSLRGLLFSIYS